MKLFTQTSGEGPDLVLVHGWGLHAGIWDPLVPLLEPCFRVTRVDLPGHGRSAWRGQADLDATADAVLAVAPSAAAWLGWSLGGLVAAQAALAAPDRVRQLVLLASTPSFVRRPGWQSAMLPALLDTFAADLEADYSGTLNRFLSLQVRGSEDGSAVLRTLRAKLLEHGEPALSALRAYLAVLRSTDLRDRLSTFRCPVLLLMGERDTLVPAAAGRQAAQLIPGARLQVIADAGHAPFLVHPRAVATALQGFLQPLNTPCAGQGHG
ncbi:MAG: pimeloyl-ACP methyl ester esterase BioH [Gammaproteobacteria bacterium]|nr:pimeloyl-ACP methyl ester esterase BioH [Gammaproteobacteria bacterium]